MEEFERIYREYFTDVYRYMIRLCGDPSLAEEITAETFFRAMHAMHTFRNESSIKSWLCAIAKNIFLDQTRQSRHRTDLSDTGMMRLPDEHPTYELVDLAKDVDEKDCELKGVPYRVYTPQKAAPEGGRACIVYVHGGGFVMGGLTRLNNINRRLADVMNAVAVHVDYTLSPEAAYPTGVNECYDVIEELADNAQAYGIDPEKIYILGDSAGGNMCVSIVLRDQELGRNLIKAQVLYYPVLDLSVYSHDTFEMEMMGKDLDPMITAKISQMWKANNGSEGINGAYLQGFTSGEDYHVSPLLAPDEVLAKLPKTIMITAEYDFLRIQCEEFVAKLEELGADVSYYMYAGTFHGFLERVGVFAEADHSIHLVADLLK